MRAGLPYVRLTGFLAPQTVDGLLDVMIGSEVEFRGRGRRPDGQPTFRRLSRPLGP